MRSRLEDRLDRADPTPVAVALHLLLTSGLLQDKMQILY